MQNNDFELLAKNLFMEAEKVLSKKGPEYSSTSDRLLNFKQIAQKKNLHPITVCEIYQQKHIDSIDNFTKKLKDKGYEYASEHLSEPIRGRIIDVINYYVLLYALIEENRK